MAKWIKIGPKEEVIKKRDFKHKKKHIALFNLDGEIFALDNVCSHEYSLLSEGEVWDGNVYCPKHGSKFDIKTGKVKSFPATKPVATYPIKEEDNTVFIRI